LPFNPLQHPICLERPDWLRHSAWAEHLPFAMYLVSAARPATLVELGTYNGVSYCGFCEAISRLELSTRAFAVDTWQGDEHAGTLDTSAYDSLREYHDARYGGFSTLVHSTFDDARDTFEDGTIDILHIDGFHSYDAVSHDFEYWVPKMSKRGIMLLHDTNERSAGFGVWKFWEELVARYKTFEFLHGHGLGLVSVGSETPTELEPLFAADESDAALIRAFFRALGRGVEAQRVSLHQHEVIEELRSYERAVKRSRLVRGYRVLSERGLVELIRKIRDPNGN
jgi:hypothetical protein